MRTLVSPWPRPLQGILLAALLLTSGIAAAVHAEPTGPPAERALSFLVLGDWGRDGHPRQRDVAREMARAAERLEARFVISTGDNFYPNGVSSVSAPGWKKSFEDVYTQPALQVPWYVVLGNHDYRGDSQAELDYAKKSKRWRMPGRYWAHREKLPGGGVAEFFFLDTSPFAEHYGRERHKYPQLAAQDEDAQLRWLERALRESRAEWRIVVGHHPVYSEGSAHGNTVELIKRLKPLLERYGVQLYLNGHDHDLQHIVVKGIHYVTSGAGSTTRSTNHGRNTKFSLGKTSGFVSVSMTADSLTARFVDFKGEERYRFTTGR